MWQLSLGQRVFLGALCLMLLFLVFVVAWIYQTNQIHSLPTSYWGVGVCCCYTVMDVCMSVEGGGHNVLYLSLFYMFS